MNEIIVTDAVKTYGKTVALKKVCVKFEKGKIYGLIGRNGAGKSTLIKAIGNRIFLDSGTITIDGEKNIDNEKALEKIYIMSESNTSPNYKIYDIFKWSKIYNNNFDVEYAKKLAKLFKLDLKKNTKSLSTGYKTILKFILTMSSNLPYLFLDEPVLGLDATHREYVYKIILDVQMKNSCTMVISTHIIEEISNLIENVIIINEGNIIEDINKEELLKKYYLASGVKDAVEKFAVGKTVVSKEYLGGLATVCIKGIMPKVEGEKLNFSYLNLQQLFVRITQTKGEESYETISNL